MPIGRIVLNTISNSKKMPQLKSDGARLLYTWLLTHVDVNGCYSADPQRVKNLIFTKLKKSFSTVASYLEDLADVGSIILYESDGEHYLWIPDFVIKQPYLNPEREARPTIPLPTPDQLTSRIGVQYELVVSNSNTIIKVKVKVKDKVKVNVKGNEPQNQISTFESPQNQTKRFFQAVKDNSVEFSSFVKALAERNNGDETIIKNEIIKFISYWTEKSQTGKKERWEMERTFEVVRRLATWFSNVNKFNGFSTQTNKGREILGL